MFNIGFSELILVLLIAFLVVGPQDLPKVARWLGRAVKKLRLLIREVKKETGWDDLEKEFKDTKTEVNTTLNDLKKDVDISPELKDASSELRKSVSGVEDELKQAERQGKESTAKKEA
ncbi:MAG: twin-arginine translocase subunit TatB [Clostridia bacterium]|nr:twin-arginine translocase subunit TatB [Clostridia bacterium]